MPLDMFQQSQADAEAFVARHNAPRLPAGFGDAFEAAWNENRMFGQSIAGLNARAAALNDYTEDVTRRTGERFDDLPNDLTPPERLSMINDRVAKLNVANPEFTIAPMTDDELDKRAVAKSRMARSDLQEMSAREKTLGGSFGQFLGGATGTATDPVNLVVAPLAAPEGLGVLGTALAWAGIAGGTQAAIEATGAPFRDTVQPGYSQSAEPAKNILGAAAFGGATGGALKGLGMAWARAKTGTWPRSIRDAGNVVESEANVANSNVLPGLEGDVAHREALSKTIDDVVAGRRVEVPDAVTAPLEPKPGFDVYHGSPHDFDRFSMEKIGTGEGAQSFGHGLYFAENEAVARQYFNTFDDNLKHRPIPDDVKQALSSLDNLGFSSPKEALRELRSNIRAGEDYRKIWDLNQPQDATAVAKVEGYLSIPFGNASMYRVRINADRNAFLDWDRPLSEQSEPVKDALRKVLKNEIDWSQTGEKFIRDLGHDPQNSKLLSDAGIPGIKYFDQFSRGLDHVNPAAFPTHQAYQDAVIDAAINKKARTRNFVLFDDKLAQITHKNGEPLSLFDQHQARIDMTMDERAGARASKPTGAEIAPQLPLTPTKTEVHEATIADGVQGMARMTGYDMPREEAERVAKMVAGASSDEQARAILSTVADRPQTIADYPPTPLPKEPEAGPSAASIRAEINQYFNDRIGPDEMSKSATALIKKMPAEIKQAGHDVISDSGQFDRFLREEDILGEEELGPIRADREKRKQENLDKFSAWMSDNLPAAPKSEPRGTVDPSMISKTVGSPEHDAAMRADIDRARATGDLQIPAGVDEKGDPVFRSVDGAMDEIDAYKAAAEQIKACASPQPEPAEAA